MALYTIKPEMLFLIKDVGATDSMCTWEQAMQYLSEYIKKKKLYNPADHSVLWTENDPLNEIVRVSIIDLKDQNQKRQLLISLFQQLTPVNSSGAPVNQDTSLKGVPPNQGIKRKLSNTDLESSETSKRAPPSPMYLSIPPSPQYESATESVYSIQDYPTDSAKNSGSHSSDSESEAGSITFEYEVESLSSHHSFTTDTESEIEVIETLFVCKDGDDSDIPFWADNSDSERHYNSSDPELSYSDKWACTKCQHINRPLISFCEKCSARRANWFRGSERKKRRLSKKQRRMLMQETEKVLQLSEKPKESQDSVESEEVPESSQSQTDCSLVMSSLPVKPAGDICMTCEKKPANGLFVHGSSAHNICCYRCARKVDKRGKCPLCNRTIDRIVRLIK